MAELEVKDFIKLSHKLPIIDVRSPGEFANGHIPDAINIPLFDDRERAIIGTSYKVKGKKEAILEGLDIVGPKMASFVRKSNEVAVDNEVLVHCWRGGMRSGSFSWLLNTAGLTSHTLKGGYKSYRNLALQVFEGLNNLILLGGETGSGKTQLLNGLRQIGEQVIDLEALAKHKGSSFGRLSEQKQPGNEQFQNNLLNELLNMDLSKRIWMEDESHAIGEIRIPDILWLKMRSAPVIRLLVSKKERIAKLVEDYGKMDKNFLSEGIKRITRKLGGLQTSHALEYLENNQFAEVADICLHYYDKAYNTGLKNRNSDLINDLEVKEDFDKNQLVQIIKLKADELIKQFSN